MSDPMTDPMTDPTTVRAQYADESNLGVREAVWRPGPDGRDPAEAALAVVRAAAPKRVLEVGCGTGGFAERLRRQSPGVDLVAIDTSPRFVELTGARGVSARVADVQDLPWRDDSFDLVAAMWMLYHVPDLSRGLAEIRRVLRPGGHLVAMTNGDEHIADLRRDAGGDAMITNFSRENAESALSAHFDRVRREDFSTRAVFADHAAAMAYLDSSHEAVDWRLPAFEGPREYAGHVTLFVAD